ncbi:MAG: 23S rRNA (adenine(2503)-C(2))-methyltransferase RlmN [Chloroflexi bacterium]|nr:MAG: 23S rRNA (adenine(2503)-C(2))-methyltransferase RlmN [Chloroflexota bacterium]
MSPSTAPATPALSELDRPALGALLRDLKVEAYRADQILDAAWRSTAATWGEVTTLGKPLQAMLGAALRFEAFSEIVREDAEEGATSKLLLTLHDGAKIEAVLMRYPADKRRGSGPRATICVSSQAGCAVGCPFCATGELGFTRNLTPGEIQDQVRIARRILRGEGRDLTNVVFMGMGEPLQNADAVLAAIDGITDPKRGGIGQRRIVVSTSGVVPGIARLATVRPQVTLAVSLHAARNPLRDLLVPLNRKWPVEEVIAAAAAHHRTTGRRTTYEVTMIDGINDTDEDAQALVRVLRGSDAHVNLIPMNAVAHTPWHESTPERIEAIAALLRAAGHSVTIRRNRGRDAGAACGQLAAEQAGAPAPAAVARRRELLVTASAAALKGERTREPIAPSGPLA